MKSSKAKTIEKWIPSDDYRTNFDRLFRVSSVESEEEPEETSHLVKTSGISIETDKILTKE